jgi:signal transduction histidine kinase
MRIRPIEGLTLRIALLAGLGLSFGLWLLTGYLLTTRMTAVQRQGAELNGRYLTAQDLIASLRAKSLLGLVYVRDALFADSPDKAQGDRGKALETLRSAQAMLTEYRPISDSPIEQERLRRLAGELRKLEAFTIELVPTEGDRWKGDVRSMMERLTPRREALMETSEEVQSINRSLFVSGRDADSILQAELQRQAWTLIGIALVISAAIKWLAFKYGLSLEAKLVEQRQREQQFGADLQRLSARLVNAQEDERRRIARELHDEVGQALTAVQVELALARQRLAPVSSSGNLLGEAESLTNGALRTVRDLSQLLHPSALDDLGLTAALGSFLHGFGRRHGIRTDFIEEGLDGRLVPEAERAVYRIVQEALTNVARHARASTCRVRLLGMGPNVKVVVEDDGVGFDVAGIDRPGRGHGLGLLGMRERVAQLRGSIQVKSRPGDGGTRIEIELPNVMATELDGGAEGGEPNSGESVTVPPPVGVEVVRG